MPPIHRTKNALRLPVYAVLKSTLGKVYSTEISILDEDTRVPLRGCTITLKTEEHSVVSTDLIKLIMQRPVNSILANQMLTLNCPNSNK